MGLQEEMIVPEETIPEPSTVLASIFVGLTTMFGLRKKQQS